MMLYIITITLAAFENEYWTAVLVLSLIITTLGGRRGIYLTHGIKEKDEWNERGGKISKIVQQTGQME